MSLRRWISDQTEFFDIDEPFRLESGGVLPHVRVAYRTWGQPRREATLVCHALTGSADADEWWGELFGPGRILDPERDFIVCANVLGSCYGTTGPTSRADGAFEPYRETFPEVTIRDMVHVEGRLLEHLEVDVLDLVVGGSMGAMQVLEWPLLYPERVKAIAPIAVGAAQSAWAIALSEAQRQAIKADPNFTGGRYPLGTGPSAGLAAARAIAMTSYRSPDNFDVRFGRDRNDCGVYQAQSYLRYQGRKLVDRFDANTYLTLIAAMDSHDVGRGRGSITEALRRITQPALVISVSSDGLYPAPEVAEMAGLLPRAELVEIDAPHGHDSFLILVDEVNRHLVDFAGRHGLKASLRKAANQ